MVTNRTLVYVIIIAAVMAYFPSFLSWRNSYDALVPSLLGSLITDMQFEGYLNVTIINIDRNYIIDEVTVYRDYGKGEIILAHDLVHEPISMGKHSICIDFNYFFGYAYKIVLKIADGRILFRSQIAQ